MPATFTLGNRTRQNSPTAPFIRRTELERAVVFRLKLPLHLVLLSFLSHFAEKGVDSLDLFLAGIKPSDPRAHALVVAVEVVRVMPHLAQREGSVCH